MQNCRCESCGLSGRPIVAPGLCHACFLGLVEGFGLRGVEDVSYCGWGARP